MNNLELDLCLEYLNNDGDLNSFFEKYFEENIFISPEDIQSVAEKFDYSSINEGMVAKALNIEEPLKKLGFSSRAISRTSMAVSKAATSIGQDVKTKGITKDSYKGFLLTIQQTVDSTSKELYGEAANIAKEHGGEPGKILAALYVLLMVIITNTICSMVLMMILGPIGNLAGSMIIAPLAEELAKRYSLQNGFYPEFQIVFNIAEFSMYVSRFAPLVGLSKIISIRIICVFDHLVWGFVQFLYSNKKVQKLMGININDEEDRKACSILGYIGAVCLHSIHNSFAVVRALSRR